MPGSGTKIVPTSEIFRPCKDTAAGPVVPPYKALPKTTRPPVGREPMAAGAPPHPPSLRASPQTPPPVIPSQCAHWRGNPFPLATAEDYGLPHQ